MKCPECDAEMDWLDVGGHPWVCPDDGQIVWPKESGKEIGLGEAIAEYQEALKKEGLDQVLAVRRSAALMAQAIEEHITGRAD